LVDRRARQSAAHYIRIQRCRRGIEILLSLGIVWQAILHTNPIRILGYRFAIENTCASVETTNLVRLAEVAAPRWTAFRFSFEYGGEIDDSLLHRDIRRVHGPDLSRSVNGQVVQAVGIDAPSAGVGLAVQGINAYLLHQRTDVFATGLDLLQPKHVAQHALRQRETPGSVRRLVEDRCRATAAASNTPMIGRDRAVAFAGQRTGHEFCRSSFCARIADSTERAG